MVRCTIEQTERVKNGSGLLVSANPCSASFWASAQNVVWEKSKRFALTKPCSETAAQCTSCGAMSRKCVCMHAYVDLYIYVAQLCNAMYSLCSISTSIRICVSAHGCPLSVVLLQPCWLIVYDSSLYQSHCKHHTLKGTMRCMQQHWHGWAGSVHVAPLPLKFRSI